MIKRIFLFILVGLCFAPMRTHAQTLSYSQALEQMFAQHGGILAASKNVEGMELQKKSAFGLHLPTFTIDAKYTHMNDDLALDASIPVNLPMGSMVFPINYTIQDQNFLKANANMAWPIFTGGSVMAANKAASVLVEDSLTDLDMLKSSLGHELTDKYFGLQLAKEAALLRKEVYDGLLQHRDNTVAKEQVGMVPKVESMHAEVSLNEALRNYNQSMQDIEIARAALKNLLIAEGDPEPITPLFVLDPKHIEELEYFRSLASDSSPQAKKLSNASNLAQAGTEAKRASYMPNLYLYGSYEFYKDDLTMLDPEWFVGIGAQWKIFEGFSGHNQYQAAKRVEQRVSYQTTQAKKDLSTLAEVYYKQMLKAWEKYETAAGTLEFTKEYARIRARAFEGGFATSIDVVDAQTALSKNRLDILSAAYEFDVALSRLLALTGQHGRFELYINNIHTKIAK